MRPAIDALERARRSLWRARGCDRLGMERQNFLCQAIAALDDASQPDLADLVMAALDRLGGDGSDLGDVLADIDVLLACIEQAPTGCAAIDHLRTGRTATPPQVCAAEGRS